MDDMAMIEAAAKAAGLKLNTWPGEDFVRADHSGLGVAWNPRWNPLTDDGDAWRLAVSLQLTVAVRHHECEVFDDEGECLASEPIFSASAFVAPDQATDPQAATRRAIVTAAAAWQPRAA